MMRQMWRRLTRCGRCRRRPYQTLPSLANALSWGASGPQYVSHPPHFFELNQGPGYVPFLIANDQGRNVPAKYISVHMTANPYALGKPKSDGLTKWGEIHTASRYDYAHVKEYSDNDLCELLPAWHKSIDIDTVLVEMRNRSLQAEVHRYQCQMMRLKQLNDQMEAIQAEMFTILPKKHQCIERLSRAQVLPCVRKQIGQRI